MNRILHNYKWCIVVCIMFNVMTINVTNLFAEGSSALNNVHRNHNTNSINAEFVKSSSHPFGFDDYTNWDRPAGYHTNRQGQCRLPYISVQSSTNTGKICLSINHLANLLQQSIDLSHDNNCINISPSHVNAPINQSYMNSDISIILQAINSITIDHIYAKYSNSKIATAQIKCYPIKNISVRIVTVNNCNSSTPNFACLESQAILKITTETDNYNISSITINGNTHIINNNTVWDKQMLQQLRDNYIASKNNGISEKYLMFILNGIIKRAGIVGTSDGIPGQTSWVLATNADTRTAPHELGHCLGLFHRNSDYNALMCQTRYASHYYNDAESRLLRQNEWDLVRVNR